MAFEIIITTPNGHSWTETLNTGSKLIFGREVSDTKENEKAVTIHDPRVSSRHCALIGTGSGGTVVDLHSSNGTFLNGNRVEQSGVDPGDEIQIGSTSIQMTTEEMLSGVFNVNDSILFPKGMAVASTIDGYRILSRIGSGTVGRVYKAVTEDSGERVALKVFRLETGLSDRVLKRFVLEARIGLKLQHPSIVTTHDLVSADDIMYTVMEFIDGVDLRQLIELRGNLDPYYVLSVGARVARALQYAHEKGIIHRDVKPSNIMISRKREVKLTDFGLAKSLDEVGRSDLTREGEIVGTPYYMSPEQLKDPRNVGPPCDIYSLGVSLYHAVTGRVPFSGRTVEEYGQKVLEKDPPEPHTVIDGIPESVSTLLLAAIHRDPDMRYDSMEAFADDLERIAVELKPSDNATE